jgi:hypothetical protein
MIRLREGLTNSVVVTLNSGTGSNYYTWFLVNKDSQQEFTFTSDDVSTSPLYYNQFNIRVATQSGLTAGVINIPYGEYTYTIYNMPNAYNLNIASASSVAEVGLLRYGGTQSYNRPEATIQNFNIATQSIKTFNIL